jgi:uncharacterized membrane protein YgcG
MIDDPLTFSTQGWVQRHRFFRHLVHAGHQYWYTCRRWSYDGRQVVFDCSQVRHPSESELADEALLTESGGSLSIESGGSLSTESGGSLSTESGGSLSTGGGGSLSTESGGSLSTEAACHLVQTRIDVFPAI